MVRKSFHTNSIKLFIHFVDIILVTKVITESYFIETNDFSPIGTGGGPWIQPFGTLPIPLAIEHSLAAISDGFNEGLQPYLTDEGTSGSYILKAAAGDAENPNPVAVWKPIDEEPFAPNNPRGM